MFKRNLVILTKELAPAYLRLGGIDADGLIFNFRENDVLEDEGALDNVTMTSTYI